MHCFDVIGVDMPDDEEVIELDQDELRAVVLLARAGMVPTLLHRAAAEPSA